MNKYIYYTAWIIITAMFCITGYIGFLLVYPYKFMSTKEPIQVLTRQVNAGEDMKYAVEYCRYIEGGATVLRTIRGIDREGNETVIPTPVVETVTRVGCAKVTVPLHIPDTTAPGVYHMEAEVQFKPNPFRTLKYKFKTEDFNIN